MRKQHSTMSCLDPSAVETFTSYVDLGSDMDLINFEDEGEILPNGSDKNQPLSSADSKVEDFDSSPETLSLPEALDSKKKSEKLCGYLNKYKIGARGKVFKKRWFVLSEGTCKLLYYRTPQDVVPLGDIDIANATFSYYVGNTAGKPNVFQISCAGKVLQLEAPDKNTMMYWLQELQENRRVFSQKRTEKARIQSAEAYNRIMKESTGQDGALLHREDSNNIPALLDIVELPHSTIGEETGSVNSSHVSDISFTNWRTELRNLLANMRTSHRHNSDCESMRAVARQHKQDPHISQLVELQREDDSDHGETSPTGQKMKDTAWNSFRRRLKTRSTPPMEISLPRPGSGNVICVKCKELENFISSLRTDNQILEEELMVHQELIKQLQKQLDIFNKEKQTEQEMTLCFTEHDQLEVLRERDRRIVELEHLLATTKEEHETCRLQSKDLERQIAGLEDQIAHYHRSISTKDEQIMKFAEQITELEGGSGLSQRPNKHTVLQTEELVRLKDAVEAFAQQNKFLNKEILELNRLRADDMAREDQLVLQSKNWEAKFYQIESKYLLCLDQLRMPVRGDEQTTTQELVNQLLEDAIEGDAISEMTPKKRKSRANYDEYGFSMQPDDGEDKLVARANSSKRRSEILKHKDVDKEISQVVKWENFLMGRDKHTLQRSPELKQLTRLGIPNQYKPKVWNMFIELCVGKERKEREVKGPQYYHSLLTKLKRNTIHNPAAKQIELDLLRTLPHNRHYEDFTSENVPKLRRILLAYTQHNPDIGYCQGLNRLAAIALLFLEEEDAFWCMVAIIEYIMPSDYYSSTLLAAQTDQRVLKEFIQEKCPRLSTHLEKNEVDISLFTFNWFLTIFVDNIPVETYLRIWDTFLYEGNKILFRYALAFLKYREDEILLCDNSTKIHNYLRTLGSEITDIDRVTQIAFYDINPFAMRHINAKRQFHIEKVKAELEELDQLRAKFRSQAPDHRYNEPLSDDDT